MERARERERESAMCVYACNACVCVCNAFVCGIIPISILLSRITLLHKLCTLTQK